LRSVVPLQELSLVFHKVDSVTTGGDLTLEFGVLEVVGSVFGTTGGFLVGSELSNVVELGGGSRNVLLVVRDGKLEVEGLSSEVGNSGVELGNFRVESASEGGESLESLSLSFSLDGEGGLEVLLDVVEDPEEGIDHTLVGNSWGSFSNHGNDVEDLGVTVGETLVSKWLEGLDVGGELGEGGGTGLEELSISSEGLGDDGSGLVHHGPDGGVLGNGGVEGVNESLVLLIEGTEHGFSLTEFGVSVLGLSLSVSKDWGVDHIESLVLGDGGFEGVGLSVHGVELSSAGIGNDGVVSGDLLGFSSEALSDLLDHTDNLGNVVFRFKLEFNGVGESFSKISSFDLSEKISG